MPNSAEHIADGPWRGQSGTEFGRDTAVQGRAKKGAFHQQRHRNLHPFSFFAVFLACSFLFFSSPGELEIGNGTDRGYKVPRYSFCPDSSPTRTLPLGYELYRYITTAPALSVSNQLLEFLYNIPIIFRPRDHYSKNSIRSVSQILCPIPPKTRKPQSTS